jgi:micrococcal nuclease
MRARTGRHRKGAIMRQATSRGALLKVICLLAAVTAAGAIVHLAQAGPPKPHPTPKKRRARRHRRIVRHKKHLAHRRRIHRRRRLIIRRRAGKIVFEHGGTIVRTVPAAPAIVVKSPADLVAVPTVASGSPGAAHKVTAVVSCDTIRATVDGQQTEVRLLGVEAVDVGTDGAPDAREFLENLLKGEFVYFGQDAQVADEDEGGTTLAYLYRAPDGLLVNLEMVRQGYAVAADGYDFDHSRTFSFYEQKACADGKGIWGLVAADSNQP